MRWAAAWALAVGLWPGSALAGLMGAEWGMTPEQVAAATPAGFAPLSKGSSSDQVGNKTIGNVGRYEAGKLAFRTVFYFDEHGLESIGLSPTRTKGCRDFARSTLAEHGNPLRVSDQTILMVMIWHDAPAANRVRLLLLGGGAGCTLFYERLTDYEAIDKRLLSEGK